MNTPPTDDLRQLWLSESGEEKTDMRELLLRLERKARSFDRMIRWRDWRECAGGFLICAFSLWHGFRAANALALAADIWLLACGVWIIFYLRRYSRVSRTPAPERTMAAYRESLLETYDRQIRLLKSAVYWYVLPLWIGVLLGIGSQVGRGRGSGRLVLAATIVTAFFGFVWWLNRIAGARYIERKRQEVIALIGDLSS